MGERGKKGIRPPLTGHAAGHKLLPKFASELKIYGRVCVKQTAICRPNSHNEPTVLLTRRLGGREKGEGRGQ